MEARRIFVKDMDLDEGDMDSGITGNFTDELNSFYSEIGKIFLQSTWRCVDVDREEISTGIYCSRNLNKYLTSTVVILCNNSYYLLGYRYLFLTFSLR